jgi:predicted SAM-dependent methyltransferase
MIKREYINFDVKVHEHRGRSTDVIGDLWKIEETFKKHQFEEVIAFHFMEHFRKHEMADVMEKVRYIIRPTGKLIVECPDLIGAYTIYWERSKKTLQDEKNLERCLFGGERRHYGDLGLHRSMWTARMFAEVMEAAGFEVVHKGIGTSHGMGKRDFRVEGIKR